MHTFARTTPYALSILLTLFVVTSSACERQATKDTDVAEQKETTTAPETSPADTAPAETTEQAASNEGEETREEDDEEAPDTSARKTHTAKEILDSHKLVAYASEEVILFASEDDCFDEGCEVDWMKLDAKKDPRVLSRELTREQAKRYMDILSSPKSYGATPAACCRRLPRGRQRALGHRRRLHRVRDALYCSSHQGDPRGDARVRSGARQGR